jgi:hypothetical protein
MEYRQPDQYYSDRLVGNTTIPNELEECLQLSMIQYIEDSIIDHHLKYSELYEKYKKILLKYQRLNQYDSSIKEFTSYIEPIMNEYSMHGNPIQLDEESYQNIMVTIHSIRLIEEEKTLMNQLFSKY